MPVPPLHPREQAFAYEAPHSAFPGDVIRHPRTRAFVRVRRVISDTVVSGIRLRWYESVLPGALRSDRLHRIILQPGYVPDLGTIIERREDGLRLRVVRIIAGREVEARAPRWYDGITIALRWMIRAATKSGR